MIEDETETPAEESAVVMTRERRLAVEHWLLGAAENRDLAREQWERAEGLALLACGGVLGAVRVPARLVWAAAGTIELRETDAFLRRWSLGGGVFMDLHSHMYYFLVPGSTARQWTGSEFPDVACLGRDHYLGVPAVDRTEPRGRCYWCVPMDGPGDLCYAPEVWQLLQRAREALQEAPCVR